MTVSVGRPAQRGDVKLLAKLSRLRWHGLALVGVVVTLVAFIAGPAAVALRPAQMVSVAAALPVPQDPAAAEAPQPGASAPRTRTVQAPGWLEAEPFTTAVAALADGVVASVHVLEGESVRQGELIAELVADDAALALRQAEAAVASAEAQRREAEAMHAAARSHWEEPVERDRQVAVAAAALAEAQAELALLPSQIAEAEAALKRWQEEQARVESAFEQKAATERERLVARYEAASRAAGLATLRQRQPLLEARVERLQAESDAARRAAALRIQEKQDLDRSAAALQRAEAQLRDAQARLATAQLRMERMTITAPMDGLVQRRLKRPGDKVMVGADDPHSAHLVHLYDPRQLQVRVDVPLADAAAVSVGQRAEVVVDVLPDETFAGKVTRITHEADLQKNTLQIKVQVLDPSPLLKPEMLTRVRFLGSQAGSEPASAQAARVRVPESCVQAGRVWVVRHRNGTRGEAQSAAVQVVDRGEDGLVTVEGPLHVGDLLVRQPAGLQSGQPVRIQNETGGDA